MVVCHVRVGCALAVVASVAVMVARHACHVNVSRLGRAEHGRRHRTPNRDCECQQDQEPNAKRLHRN